MRLAGRMPNDGRRPGKKFHLSTLQACDDARLEIGYQQAEVNYDTGFVPQEFVGLSHDHHAG